MVEVLTVTNAVPLARGQSAVTAKNRQESPSPVGA